jgi:stearoyl-CoA desaturase (delta-9 desaturase)
MNSARQGLRWWELDVTYYTLLACEKLGLIWDVRRPRKTSPGRSLVAEAAPLTPL